MAAYCAAAERDGLIKNKESSWVKLKVFRPTGRWGDIKVRFKDGV